MTRFSVITNLKYREKDLISKRHLASKMIYFLQNLLKTVPYTGDTQDDTFHGLYALRHDNLLRQRYSL